MSDNKPTSLEQILLRLINPEAYSLRHEKLDEAIAAITALIPEKRTPANQVIYSGKGELTQIGHEINGWNNAIDTIKRNFTGQTGNERN